GVESDLDVEVAGELLIDEAELVRCAEDVRAAGEDVVVGVVGDDGGRAGGRGGADVGAGVVVPGRGTGRTGDGALPGFVAGSVHSGNDGVTRPGHEGGAVEEAVGGNEVGVDLRGERAGRRVGAIHVVARQIAV